MDEDEKTQNEADKSRDDYEEWLEMMEEIRISLIGWEAG